MVEGRAVGDRSGGAAVGHDPARQVAGVAHVVVLDHRDAHPGALVAGATLQQIVTKSNRPVVVAESGIENRAQGAEAELLTREHGRHLGLVRGGYGSRLKPVLQPGNSLRAVWRARLDEHLGVYAVEGLKLRAGVNILHVPYRGSADALNDLLAGNVHMMNEIVVLPHVKAGKLRHYGVSVETVLNSERTTITSDLRYNAREQLIGFRGEVDLRKGLESVVAWRRADGSPADGSRVELIALFTGEASMGGFPASLRDTRDERRLLLGHDLVRDVGAEVGFRRRARDEDAGRDRDEQRRDLRRERVAENAALFDFELSSDDMARIDTLDRGQRVGSDPDNFKF